MASAPPTELWDVDRLAEFLGKTPRFVYRLTSEKRIRFVKLGRDIRFDPSDVADYVERLKTGADPASPTAAKPVGHSRRPSRRSKQGQGAS